MSRQLVAQMPGLPASPGAPEGALTRPQKAAVIIRVLLNENAAPDLRSLGLDPLKNVVRTMATLGDVDKSTLNAVIDEFLGDLGEFGLSLRSTLEETVAVLQDHVSEETLTQIKREFPNQPRIDLWQKIANIEGGPLTDFLSREHAQVAAVVLSKLPNELAAQVLSGFEDSVANDIIVAITRVSDIDVPVVEAIAGAIHEHFFAVTAPKAFDALPAERIGGILNFTKSQSRERLLDAFAIEDPETASAVRRVMFTFADIPVRVPVKDVAKLVRAVQQDVLARALLGAGAECPDAKTFILENLTSRLSQQISEEVEELGEVRQRDIEAAMASVVTAIRGLVDAGEIDLQYGEEED